MRNANVPNERSFQGLSKTCNLSLLSISETEECALKCPEPLSEIYQGKTLKSGTFCEIHNSSFLRECLSSLITARNSGHSNNLGSDSARGFSDAVLGDSFAIDRTINNKLTSVFLNKYLFNQILYIANRSFNV